MDYQEITVGIVIKRFVLGWLAAGLLLVVVSCVKYREYIATAFANNTWNWINAVMPIIILVWVVCYCIKSLFR